MRLPCPAPTEKLTLALTRGRSSDCHSMHTTEAQGIVIVKYKEVSRPSGRKVPAATRKLLSGAKRECTLENALALVCNFYRAGTLHCKRLEGNANKMQIKCKL